MKNYALVRNNELIKYPVVIEDLRFLHPDVSFPQELDSKTLAEYGLVEVTKAAYPQVGAKERISGYHIRFDGSQWIQEWEVSPIPKEVLDEETARKRRAAYELESDYLFFEAQRGEATMQEWKDKVAEIKLRYPKS